jgi:hypothetical protein
MSAGLVTTLVVGPSRSNGAASTVLPSRTSAAPPPSRGAALVGHVVTASASSIKAKAALMPSRCWKRRRAAIGGLRPVPNRHEKVNCSGDVSIRAHSNYWRPFPAPARYCLPRRRK